MLFAIIAPYFEWMMERKNNPACNKQATERMRENKKDPPNPTIKWNCLVLSLWNLSKYIAIIMALENSIQTQIN